MSNKITDEIKNEVIKLAKNNVREAKFWLSQKLNTKKTQTNKYYNQIMSGPKNVKLSDNGKIRELEIKNTIINNLEDVLKITNVDTNIWNVDRYSIKNEIKQVLIDNKKTTQPIFNFNISLKRKTIDIENILKGFIKNAGEHAPTNWKIKSQNKNGKYLYFIHIPDAHIGSLVWNLETNWGDYDIKIACKRYSDALDNLLSKVDFNEIEKVLFMVGSDGIHFDSPDVATTSGTKLTSDGRWQKVFNSVCKLYTDSIEKISQFAPVDAIVISGNHGEVSEYHLGAYLQAWFRNNTNVVVINNPSLRKYYGWGKNLFGITHEPIKDLALIMMRENNSQISNYKYFAWFLGHTHTETLKTDKGIRLFTSPAICSPCDWTVSKGYIGNELQAQAFLFDKETGLEAIYYSDPIESK